MYRFLVNFTLVDLEQVQGIERELGCYLLTVAERQGPLVRFDWRHANTVTNLWRTDVARGLRMLEQRGWIVSEVAA